MSQPDYDGLRAAIETAEATLRKLDSGYRVDLDLSEGKLLWTKRANEWHLLYENGKDDKVLLVDAPITVRFEAARVLGEVWDAIEDKRQVRAADIDEAIENITAFIERVEGAEVAAEP